jgi:ethanolamine utilization protein EutP (predicted NTPase)
LDIYQAWLFTENADQSATLGDTVAICAAVNTIDALVKLARCVQAEESALASDDPAEYHKHPAFYEQVRQALADLNACIAEVLDP